MNLSTAEQAKNDARVFPATHNRDLLQKLAYPHPPSPTTTTIHSVDHPSLNETIRETPHSRYPLPTDFPVVQTSEESMILLSVQQSKPLQAFPLSCVTQSRRTVAAKQDPNRVQPKPNPRGSAQPEVVVPIDISIMYVYDATQRPLL